VEALTGRFSEPHAFVYRIMLGRVDDLDAAIAQLTARVDAEIAPPSRHRRPARHHLRGEPASGSGDLLR
jgi:hypothetical protein